MSAGDEIFREAVLKGYPIDSGESFEHACR
jgi:hypothetical protein